MWTDVIPVLAGGRILVTAQRRSGELAAALQRRGADVDVVPTIGVVPHIDEGALVRRTEELIVRPPDTLVVTTGIGFRSWLDTAETAGLAEPLLGVLATTRLVARGPKARGALQAAGLNADWVAESETSTEITEFLLGEGLRGRRIAVQHHGAGDRPMEEAFETAGAETVSLDVYRWGPPPDPAAVRLATDDLGQGRYDAVVFTSAPGAKAWLDALRDGGTLDTTRRHVERGHLFLAAVGPVTAEPLAYAGLTSSRPTRSRMGALVRLVITELGGDRNALRTVHGTLRIRAGAVTLDHRPVPISPSGLAVLRRLAATPNHVVTREEILQVLPGDSSDPHTAEVAVARLREALRAGTGDRRLVRTVVKRGYVLVAG
jgi:uroporphyrinogen-III synthase